MIKLTNFTDKEINLDFLSEAEKIILKQEGLPMESSVNLFLLGPKRMKALNQKFRAKNKLTDVLSFAEKDIAEEHSQIVEPSFLGEIAICPYQIKKQAKERNVSFEQEFIWAFIHGFLHLLGYDHQQGAVKAEKMKEKEKHYLQIIFKQ